MKYLQLSLVVLLTLFVFTAIIGVLMKIANYIGEKLGLGNFFVNVFKKKGRN